LLFRAGPQERVALLLLLLLLLLPPLLPPLLLLLAFLNLLIAEIGISPFCTLSARGSSRAFAVLALELRHVRVGSERLERRGSVEHATRAHLSIRRGRLKARGALVFVSPVMRGAVSEASPPAPFFLLLGRPMPAPAGGGARGRV
jgi:hypothetical protein